MTAPYDLPSSPPSPGDLPPLDVRPRAGRVRARMAAAGVDALARHGPDQRALADRLHRLGRPRAPPARRPGAGDRRPLRGAGHRGAGRGRRGGPRRHRAFPGRPDGRAGRRGPRARSPRPRGRARELGRPRALPGCAVVHPGRHVRAGRGRAADQGRGGGGPHRARLRAGQPRPGGRVRPARRRAHRGGVRPRPRGPHARPRRGGPELPVHRREWSQRGEAPPRHVGPSDPRRRLPDPRLRRAVRRLPLRHDPHRAARRRRSLAGRRVHRGRGGAGRWGGGHPTRRWPGPTSTRCAGRASRPPATASTSPTAPATGSAC